MGAMGNFERGWHVQMPGRTRLDPNRTARVESGMSARHFPIGAVGILQGLCGTHRLYWRKVEKRNAHKNSAFCDVEPNQLHNAGRPRVDVQHTTRTQTRAQHNRACHRRLDDDAPGDAELAAEEVGAGSKDHVANGCVGECTGQAGDGAHQRGPHRYRWKRRQRRRTRRRRRRRGWWWRGRWLGMLQLTAVAGHEGRRGWHPNGWRGWNRR
jgi:hypothetical protein